MMTDFHSLFCDNQSSCGCAEVPKIFPILRVQTCGGKEMTVPAISNVSYAFAL
jgi:hypothetical protein